MAYTLQALVGKTHLFGPIRTHAYVHVISLHQGFSLVPLTSRLLREHGIEFLPLTDEGETPEIISAWMARITNEQCGAYVESEIFGGTGLQAGVVWCNGIQSGAPTLGSDAINLTLERLGVEKGGAMDRFEALNLGRHRSTDDWVPGTP